MTEPLSLFQQWPSESWWNIQDAVSEACNKILVEEATYVEFTADYVMNIISLTRTHFLACFG